MSLEEKNRKVKVIDKSLKSVSKFKDQLKGKSKDTFVRKLKGDLRETKRGKVRRKSEKNLKFKRIPTNREQYIIEVKAYRDYLKQKLTDKNFVSTSHTYYYYYWYYYWLNEFIKLRKL